MAAHSHAHPSTAREFVYAPVSTRPSSVRSYHTPSSRKPLSTPFHYAPLSSTTSSFHSLHRAPSSSYSSEQASTHYASSVRISLPSLSTSNASLTTASATLVASRTPIHEDSVTSGPAVWLTVTVSILLGILMTTAVTIWLMEIRGQKQAKRPRYGTRSAVVGQPKSRSGSVGLGISLHPTVEEKKEVGHREHSLNWFDRMMEEAVDLAVSRSRTELGSDAEEELLLPVQKDERVGGENGQIDREFESTRGC